MSVSKIKFVMENPEYDNNNIVGAVKRNIDTSCNSSLTSSCLSPPNSHALIEPSNEYLFIYK